MAEQAHKVLRHYGAKTKMVAYEGGHGWRGDVYGRIREGMRWLELNTGTQVQREEAAKIQPEPPQSPSSFPLVDSFETGRTAPTGWRRGANVQGVRYIWDKNQAFEGKASLCLSKTAKRFIPVAQWSRRLDHDGTSRSLHVSAQVKARQAAKGAIDVQFLGNDGKQRSHQWAAYIGAKKAGDPPANHDWKQYSKTVAIPEGTESIIIGLQIYGPGTIWFDQLKADYVNEQGG
jgi:RNA polymerase sigma-70 factor (ECF subfamily)